MHSIVQAKMQQENEQLIAVSSDNVPLHPVQKILAHQGKGLLHRAFTVFLFNEKNEVLITQRSQVKPLWPGWWDAACSSHQWFDSSGENRHETAVNAAKRRLPYELGTNAVGVRELAEVFSYEYHAVYSQEWSENEINSIVTGRCDGSIVANKQEVAAHAWLTTHEIDSQLTDVTVRYAPWFPLAWKELIRRKLIPS